MASAAAWLDANPIVGDDVICHGDLHARNIVLHEGRLAAVLDWEIAARAPRAFDVARSELLLLLMPGVGPLVVRPLVRVLGLRAASQFVRAYRLRTPIDEVMLDRCRALHALRLVALIRAGQEDGAKALWRPFERTLERRWTKLTGSSLR